MQTFAEKVQEASSSTLVNRNVRVSGHRTSMRLEPVMWEALEEICRRESRTIHDICTLVDGRRRESSLTAAMRVFILGYFRAAVTEQGHVLAGHGPGYRSVDGARSRLGPARPYQLGAR